MKFKLVSILNEQISERLIKSIDRLRQRAEDREVIDSEPSIMEGMTKIIYGFTSPEVRSIWNKLMQGSELFENLFGKNYLRRQDRTHLNFLEGYKVWTKGVLKGLESYPFSYPVNGSSEALKDTFNQIRTRYPKASVGIFMGEYQGAYGFINASGISKVEIDRNLHPQEAISQRLQEGDFFYLSQPSGMDGNIWKDFNSMVKLCEEKKIRLLVDLSYVGGVAKPYQIDVSSQSIHSVFFSLSKLGMYYMRIGGLFTREANDFLYGNIWFKNMFSLTFGTEYMKQFSVREVAAKYAKVQAIAVRYLNQQHQMALIPSDVFLLAYQMMKNAKELPANKPQFAGMFREQGSTGCFRPCITPLLDILVGEGS